MRKLFILMTLSISVLTHQWCYAIADMQDKTVLVAILARNKAHVLEEYLTHIENQDYDKKLISVYINTNNNCDRTEEILVEWMNNHRHEYRNIEIENREYQKLDSTDPHVWTPERFHVLAQIRNRSLQKAVEAKSDFYFVVDCDNFIAPCTLKQLIAHDKPIIAPMLVAVPEKNDYYSNYFCAVDAAGYYKQHDDYVPILERSKSGVFKVPVVHCTYLIQSQYLDKLNYLDGSDDYEFVIFSKSARQNGVDQYICNDCDYGTLLHFYDSPNLVEESARFKEYLNAKNLIVQQPKAEDVFTSIYDIGQWGKNSDGLGHSGSGSSVPLAQPYMLFLQDFMNANGIKSVVDAGCGDWTFSQHMNWGDILYAGYDVVKSVIDRNHSCFGSPNVKFVHANAAEFDLPPADLLLSKDVLQHCADEDIHRLLAQIKKFKHCLITNDVDEATMSSSNVAIKRGGWHTLDLTKPPFNVVGTKILTYRACGVTKQVLYIRNN